MVKQKYPELSLDEVRKIRHEAIPGFLCFFSTRWNGFVKDPELFTVPIDDHGFHRGDGVFEAIRVVGGKPYLLRPHLERLTHSAGQIGLELPLNIDEISGICEQAIEVAGEPQLIFRLFVTRGPGSFGVNPKESPASQLYLATLRFKGLSEADYAKGVRVGRSQVPSKPPFFARVKSLNYLNNVLMKSEANKRNLDYMLFVNSQDGALLESGTENLVIINREGALVHPPLEQILRGCTMARLFDLAESKKVLPVMRGRSISENDLLSAREAFFIGTTLDVLPIVEYEGKPIARGELSLRLREILRQDQGAN